MAVSGRAVMLEGGKVESVRRERELYPSSETARGGLDWIPRKGFHPDGS